MADTHKITKAKAVRIGPGKYGIEFTFDDGYMDVAEVGDKETVSLNADYAREFDRR